MLLGWKWNGVKPMDTLALSAVLPSKSLLLFASFERELLLNCMGSPKPPSEKAPCTFLLSNLSGIGSNFSDIIVKVDASFFLLRKLQVVQNLSSGRDYTEHSVVWWLTNKVFYPWRLVFICDRVIVRVIRSSENQTNGVRRRTLILPMIPLLTI